MRRKAQEAHAALEEAAKIVERITGLEHRLFEMGMRYLHASCRITELEQENAGLREETNGEETRRTCSPFDEGTDPAHVRNAS